jgi:hypothetical protein
MKLCLVLFLNFLFSVPLYAKMVQQEQANFMIRPTSLLQGEIHVSYTPVDRKELRVHFPEAAELDSLGLLAQKDLQFILTKSVFIVKKPVGFFDSERLRDEKFISDLLGGQKVKKKNADAFYTPHFKLTTYYDSDDLSSLPNSKVTKAATAAKKLDVISQGASAVVLKEFSQFKTAPVAGATSVTSYVPLKEDRTLIITYQLTGVKTAFDFKGEGLENFFEEQAAIKKLLDKYPTK